MKRCRDAEGFWSRRRVLAGGARAACFGVVAGVSVGMNPAAGQSPPAAGTPDLKTPDLRKITALVMVEDRGCPYCARFDAEARDSYVNSPEGKLAPLLRYRRGDPAIAFIERVVYSPTFILLVEGREAARATGYIGAELFWMEIARLMQTAGLKTGG